MQNDNNNFIYFNSFGAEHIPKEIKVFMNNNNNKNNNNNNKNITTNIFRVRAYYSIIYWFY